MLLCLSVSNKNDSPAGPPKLMQVQFYHQEETRVSSSSTSDNFLLKCKILKICCINEAGFAHFCKIRLFEFLTSFQNV